MTQSDKKEGKDKERETQKAGSAPEKEKKLSGKAAEKLKFYGVVAFLSLLCAGFIWFIFKPDASETVEGISGINTTIPDAIAPETMADKQKAYELEEMKKRRQEKVRTLQDMAGDCLTPDTVKPEEDTPKTDAIRESREKQRQISRQITSFYQEPKESPRVDELERQVKELNEKLERERKGQDPLELMEKSYEMAARYFPGQTGGQVKNIQPAGVTGGSSGNPAAIAAGRATENVVSSLAVPPVPDTIPRNYGFATAVGGGQLAGANTIRACVAEDQTVTTGA
jgi:putative conjugative transposon TraM protein